MKPSFSKWGWFQSPPVEYLVNAAPHRIGQAPGGGQVAPGDHFAHPVAGGGPQEGVFGSVAVDHLLGAEKAAQGKIVAGDEALLEFHRHGTIEEGETAQFSGSPAAAAASGLGSATMAARSASMRSGGEVTGPLDDLPAAAVEDDDGRPAVIAVALGEVGPGVVVGPHWHKIAGHRRGDAGVGPGPLVHDVAPVAPTPLPVRVARSAARPEPGRRRRRRRAAREPGRWSPRWRREAGGGQGDRVGQGFHGVPVQGCECRRALA